MLRLCCRRLLRLRWGRCVTHTVSSWGRRLAQSRGRRARGRRARRGRALQPARAQQTGPLDQAGRGWGFARQYYWQLPGAARGAPASGSSVVAALAPAVQGWPGRRGHATPLASFAPASSGSFGNRRAVLQGGFRRDQHTVTARAGAGSRGRGAHMQLGNPAPREASGWAASGVRRRVTYPFDTGNRQGAAMPAAGFAAGVGGGWHAWLGVYRFCRGAGAAGRGPPAAAGTARRADLPCARCVRWFRCPEKRRFQERRY